MLQRQSNARVKDMCHSQRTLLLRTLCGPPQIGKPLAAVCPRLCPDRLLWASLLLLLRLLRLR